MICLCLSSIAIVIFTILMSFYLCVRIFILFHMYMTVVVCHPEHDSVHNGGDGVCIGSCNSVGTYVMTTGLCNLIEFV